jgi:uncharacterized protein YbbC (DUF1343 family)
MTRVQIHVNDSRALRAVALGIHIIAALRELHPDMFGWEATHFDRLAGGPALRAAIEAGESADYIAASWHAGEAAFRRRRKAMLLYETR